MENTIYDLIETIREHRIYKTARENVRPIIWTWKWFSELSWGQRADVWGLTFWAMKVVSSQAYLDHCLAL